MNFNFLTSDLLRLLSFLAILLSLFIFGLIFRVWRKIVALKREDKAELEAKVAHLAKTAGDDASKKAWSKLVNYLNSNNQADWKLAILEADVMLDKLVERMGYEGANLGERLKNVEPSDFTTLQDAWEAHKVRNRIAHESDYVLTSREARRVMDLFEKVFREFDFI